LWFRGDGPAEEAAARFHHRLVWTHPFPNGNGRHARMAADLCLRSLGLSPLTWGHTLQLPTDEVRRRYITALRAADAGDLGPLVAFVTTCGACQTCCQPLPGRHCPLRQLSTVRVRSGASTVDAVGVGVRSARV